uniref:GTPase IMAP family member 4-like n=1 Tax=Crassostrea virginica TaxID=6565 RepID=A0A8B8BK64_CRAVI|nr:GTPase IMAP family member 4-like [Crassostrea virginica]XP_022303234.1 GTPase IMAP family member 4-like [Crassostrea virginica]
MASGEERNIILLGKLGMGKSQSGNGILGLEGHFKTKKGWSSSTKVCEYGYAKRNGCTYRVFDTPGINSFEEMKEIDVDAEIIRCLFCTSPGFHTIVLVVSADERVTKDDVKMVEKLDDFLGHKGFGYMILAVTKMEDDGYEMLDDMIKKNKAINDLDTKCQSRRVILGNKADGTPEKCIQRFDEELEKLVQKNRMIGEEYFRHKYYEKASKILEKDKEDYMKKHPDVTSEAALEKVRELAALGQSPRDEELRALFNPSYCRCAIS